MQQVVKTDAVSNAVASMIKANGSKFFGVTFVKKNGELRTLNCHVRKVDGKDGHNTTARFDKYVTVVLNEKDSQGREQFRNVNLETIVSLSMGRRKMFFK
ncbi:hypothetical protein PSPHG_CDS_0108 [Pseudomonas phage Psxphi15]